MSDAIDRSESEKDVRQRRTTDRGTDVGTSEPGVPPRIEPEEETGAEGPEGPEGAERDRR